MSNYDVIKEPIKKLIYLRLEIKPILKHLMADFITILKIFLLICMSSTQNALQVKKEIDNKFSYFDKLDYVRPKICSKWPPDKIDYLFFEQFCKKFYSVTQIEYNLRVLNSINLY